MNKPEVLAPCQRCFRPFLMIPDLAHISDYCPLCVRILGYRLTPARQQQLNAGWRYMRATGVANTIPEYAPGVGSRGPMVVVGRYADALREAAQHPHGRGPRR